MIRAMSRKGSIACRFRVDCKLEPFDFVQPKYEFIHVRRFVEPTIISYHYNSISFIANVVVVRQNRNIFGIPFFRLISDEAICN